MDTGAITSVDSAVFSAWPGGELFWQNYAEIKELDLLGDLARRLRGVFSRKRKKRNGQEFFKHTAGRMVEIGG